MASPVSYNFEPNTTVYVIHSCDGNSYVTHGEVLRVRIEVLVTATKIKYDIRLANNAGTIEFDQVDVFADKATAMSEYDSRTA